MKRGADTTGTHVWLVLMKAHRALARHATRSIDEVRLCASDFKILEYLLHKGPRPVNEIGRTIDLTSGSITSAVDRLEAKALVARGADPADRRSRIVRLTAAGEALITEAFARHTEAMNAAASGLTAAERATLVGLLKKLGQAADASLAEATPTER